MSDVSTRDVTQWPSVRDVTRQLDLSQPYVHRLIKLGRLQAVRTRLGWLVDPDSVDAYKSIQAARRKIAC